MTGPSKIEIQNAGKVLDMLTKMDDVSFEEKREDIFLVTEPETGLSLVVDVEESTVCFLMDICHSDNTKAGFLQTLLSANNESVHGAFCLANDGKILLKENLEIENLDYNEFVAAVTSMFTTAYKTLPKIEKYMN